MEEAQLYLGLMFVAGYMEEAQLYLWLMFETGHMEALCGINVVSVSMYILCLAVLDTSKHARLIQRPACLYNKREKVLDLTG